MELRFYDESYQQEIEDYQLLDLSFTALPNACLKVSQKRVDYRPILGIEHDKIVCFFVLDSRNDKFKYSDNLKSLLYEGFFYRFAREEKRIRKSKPVLTT